MQEVKSRGDNHNYAKQESQIKRPPADADISPLLDRQIDKITEGLPHNFNKGIRMLSEDHIKVIIDYVTAVNTEISLSTNYRKDIIRLLTHFCKFHVNYTKNNKFDFKTIVRSDVYKLITCVVTVNMIYKTFMT
jgi:hypothetical protein